MDPVAALAIYCLLTLAFSIAGGLLPLARGLTHTLLQVYLSFAAGVMLGAAFFHMLPEGVHLLGASESSLQSGVTWLVAGLLALFFVERFFAFHHHEVPAEQARPEPETDAAALLAETDSPTPAPAHPPKSLVLAWGPATVGLCFHTLAGGVALASAVTASGRQDADRLLSVWVFLAILLHKPADSLTIVTLMLGGGASRKRAHLVNLIFALMVPLGVLAFFFGRNVLALGSELPFTGAALAFSAGTFLCIALSDLLPELQFHEHDRLILSASLVAGIFLMYVVAKLHP